MENLEYAQWPIFNAILQAVDNSRTHEQFEHRVAVASGIRMTYGSGIRANPEDTFLLGRAERNSGRFASICK